MTERFALAALAGPITEGWKARWLATMRWRRRVETAIAPAKLTFTEWQVLEATHALIEQTGDAVSQNQVAAAVELDRRAVSRAMSALDRKQLVSRCPCFIGTSHRVFLTEEARCLLSERRAAVEAASKASS